MLLAQALPLPLLWGSRHHEAHRILSSFSVLNRANLQGFKAQAYHFKMASLDHQTESRPLAKKVHVKAGNGLSWFIPSRAAQQASWKDDQLFIIE